MLKSPGRRFIVVGILVLLMFIPLFFAAEIVNDRKSYSRQTIESVGREWGGAQSLSGPQLVIPVEQTVTRLSTRPRLDPATGAVMIDSETGKELSERFEETVTLRAAPVFLYPDRFQAEIDTKTQIRSRGIFNVPVYQASLKAGFDFSPNAAEGAIATNERLLWDQAELRLTVSSNRGLRGTAVIEADGTALRLEPLNESSGLKAQTGDPRGLTTYDLELGLNGAQSLYLAPVGRDNRVTMTGDWPHPSFGGAFLPDGHDIDETGFSASWTIPHLARALPQVSREDPDNQARHQTGFGLRYVQPNDFYQKAFRAARYGILFIALTFLTIVLIERGIGRPVHPVQYILVGLAQSVFILLMVSYAEHLGFLLAYLLSAGATIALLTLYGAIGLKLGRRTAVLGSLLVIIYAVLYLILQSADYALLAGSTLAFLALALTMIVTRNEDWYGPEAEEGEKKPGLLARVTGSTKPATPESGPPAPPTNPVPEPKT